MDVFAKKDRLATDLEAVIHFHGCVEVELFDGPLLDVLHGGTRTERMLDAFRLELYRDRDAAVAMEVDFGTVSDEQRREQPLKDFRDQMLGFFVLDEENQIFVHNEALSGVVALPACVI